MIARVGTGLLYAACTRQGAPRIRTNPGRGGASRCALADPSGIVVGRDLSGAYRSLDGGQTCDGLGAWHGLGSRQVSALAFDCIDPSLPSSVRWQAIPRIRSVDGGATWMPANDGRTVCHPV